MEMEFWTSFSDELKAYKILTMGVIVYTISVVVLFVDSLIKGKQLWFIVALLPAVWMILAPKKIKVYDEGIYRCGRLIRWEELKLINEENGKFVFKYKDLEIRIPREVVRRL
jgi:hypothetical protein